MQRGEDGVMGGCIGRERGERVREFVVYTVVDILGHYLPRPKLFLYIPLLNL